MRVTGLWGKFLGILALIAGALAIAAYYWVTAGGSLPLQGDKYTFKAVIDEPQQLLKHGDVRAAGIKVGKIKEIRNRVTQTGVLAEVEMQVNDDIAPVYRDAVVQLRQKTLVGENYIEVERGTPKAGELPEGGVLPLSHSKEAVPIDEILSALSPDTRKHLSRGLRALGATVDQQGAALNDLFGELPPMAQDGARVMGALDDQREVIGKLVDQGATVLQAIADRGHDLQTLVRSARVTAETVAARDNALESAFEQFPPTLRQARTSLAKLQGFSNRATPVARDLRVGLAALESPVTDLAPTARSARGLFASLDPMIERANPMVSQLRTFSKQATPQVQKLEAFLRQTNPALDYVSPYYKDLGSFLSNFSSSATNDKWGAMLNCHCPAGIESLGIFSDDLRKLTNPILQSETVEKFYNYSHNPIRPPGSLPRSDKDFEGTYPRVEAGK